MAPILLSVALVVVFIVGIISPHKAGKIQRKTNEKTTRLKRLSNWFWDPITWWAKLSLESSRKAVNNVAEWGKKVRRKSK